MGKKFCFFIIVAAVFFLSSMAFSQDQENFEKKISAQNTQIVSEDDQVNDDFDDEFFDEFNETIENQTIFDPLYYFNYLMYTFNDLLYYSALKPLATGYKAITPDMVRKGVKNFFHNLVFPVRFVNNIFQGEIKDSRTEACVFLINSTIGVLGFVQVAQNEFNLHTFDEDLGQTFGSYSIGNGFYIVLPVFGPSTLRDAIGSVGDYFLTPLNYFDPIELSTGIKAYDTINTTSFRLGDYEALKKASIDPYIAIRDAYIQNRIEKIKQ